jgi:hypothetical protein
LRPATGVYEPGGHEVGVDMLVVGQNVPAAQGVQSVPPELDVPAAHGAQSALVVDPAGLPVPESHWLHCELEDAPTALP